MRWPSPCRVRQDRNRRAGERGVPLVPSSVGSQVTGRASNIIRRRPASAMVLRAQREVASVGAEGYRPASVRIGRPKSRAIGDRSAGIPIFFPRRLLYPRRRAAKTPSGGFPGAPAGHWRIAMTSPRPRPAAEYSVVLRRKSGYPEALGVCRAIKLTLGNLHA